MTIDLNNAQMLELAAKALKSLLGEIAFVGGVVTSLYTDSKAVAEPRPTDDVDCVIEVSSRIKYAELEKRLRGLGLEHDVASKLLCRWRYQGLTIDVMPTDPKILGFSNPWYEDGLRLKEPRVLSSGIEIFVFPLAYFLASKYTAHKGRAKDWRYSHDLEDFLVVLDGNKAPLEAIKLGNKDVQAYLSECATELSKRSDYDEILLSHLGQEGAGRLIRIKKLIDDIAPLS